jgi:hypothetical protein
MIQKRIKLLHIILTVRIVCLVENGLSIKVNEIKYTFYEDYKNINDILLPHTKKVIETDGDLELIKLKLNWINLTEIDFE